MPTMFAVDENDDLYLDAAGNIAIVTGLEAIKQWAEHKTKTQLGELVLAVQQGVPNQQTVWDGNPNVPQFEAAVRSILLQIPDITDVINFETRQEGKIFKYTTTLVTPLGNVAIHGNL